MKYVIDPKEVRTYHIDDSCIFKKNNEEYGGLSNMATIYPLSVNGISIKTSEALYQACRFPHLPDIQKKIIDEKSPMTVKMISSGNKKRSRKDWEDVRLKVMKWCLNVKLAQNFVSFGTLLHQTGLKNIVENSSKDNFWGAIPSEDGSIFKGKNALGRLLMELRKTYYSTDRYSLLFVEPPQIEDFLLLGESIKIIDERENFIFWLQRYWGANFSNQILDNNKISEFDIQVNISPITEAEKMNHDKASSKKANKSRKGKSKNKPENSPDLFSNLS